MTSTPASKHFKRSSTDKVLAGVCGGLGEYFTLDPTIIRIIFVLATFFGGFGLLLYIILALLVPADNQDPAEPIENVRQAAAQMGKVVEERAVRVRDEVAKQKQGGRGWAGLLLILVGALFLLGNYGLLDWFDVARLWPILLIILGLIVISKEKSAT